jgi:hypothetical protein
MFHQILICLIFVHGRLTNHDVHFLLHFIHELFGTLALFQLKPKSGKRHFLCHTRFSEENRMHLICVQGSKFHTYDRLISVISQDIAQNVQKRFINFYYTGRLEGLYTNNDIYEDTTPSSSSTCI